MKSFIKHITVLGVFLAFITAKAQMTSELYGYVNYMQSGNLSEGWIQSGDGLVHNRLNFKAFFNTHFSLEIGMRNRFMWGTTVKNVPNYSEYLSEDGLVIDLEHSWIDGNRLIAHTAFDRFYGEYQSDKWHIAFGRQRINWGKNVVWNPNDVFNAFNFFDFDYRERPGTDAIRIQRYLSGNSSIEIAKSFGVNGLSTTALRYSFHKNKYDWQLLTGRVVDDFMLGLGWEGVIKNMGFKGELSYFTPVFEEPLECGTGSETVFTASFSLDYFFKNGWYVLLSELYNSKGMSDVTAFDSSAFGAFRLSAKQLMPTKNSYLLQLSRPMGARASMSLTGIYAQELKGYYAMPQLGYSLGQNWQLDVVGQLFYSKNNLQEVATTELMFLRAGYSF